MRNKYLLAGLTIALLAAGGVTVYSSSINNFDVVAQAESNNYSSLLRADSGVGTTGNAFGDIDNYLNSGTNYAHEYNRDLTTEVFNLSLKTAFNSGGTVELSPDYSNNNGSKVPVIVKDVYLYNSSEKSSKQIYNDGKSTNSNGYSVSKVDNKYKISIPKDDSVSDYTLVFTVSPLNSKETASNAYQHPSYGVHVAAESNDGKVDGSDYTNQNGGWGVLWGQFNNDSGTPVSLKSNTANITKGSNYDLNDQVENKSDFTDTGWTLRDVNGNSLGTNDIRTLSNGTYYATFYGKEKSGLNSWNTTQINIKNPDPQPVAKGTVTTHYMDQKGTKVAADDIQTGNVGSDYSTTKKIVNGYTFSKVNGNATGIYTSGNTDVTYIYSKDTDPNTVPVKKGQAVYAVKKVGLYGNKNFLNSERKVWYTKQKRTERPMFVVTGYAYSKNGNMRYKVRDVNHGEKTDKLSGYITANNSYVVPAYYSTLPKTKKIMVINHKGINAYKAVNLTGKNVHYKKGTTLTVVKAKKHHLTTRYMLSNGQYITANKKLIIFK